MLGSHYSLGDPEPLSVAPPLHRGWVGRVPPGNCSATLTARLLQPAYPSDLLRTEEVYRPGRARLNGQLLLPLVHRLEEPAVQPRLHCPPLWSRDSPYLLRRH